MSNLQVSIRVPLGRALPELAEFAMLCEEATLSGVGVPDHHHTGRDAYLALAAMAQRTSRVTLFPATSNVVTRHPLVLAALVNSLNELAPGRVMLTVAPGFLSVEKAGEPQARRQRLGEVVVALRELLGYGRTTLGGHELHLDNRPEGGSQVIVLASGPRLLELAGEVADGVMMLVGLHPEGVEVARHHVRLGAERAGRDPERLQEILIVPFGLAADQQSAAAWPQTWFREGQQWLRYPSASNLHWLRYAGIDLDNEFDPAAVPESLARRICDAFGMFGTAAECADRLIRARQEIGIEHAFLFPTHTWANHYELPDAEVRAFSEVIGPALYPSKGTP